MMAHTCNRAPPAAALAPSLARVPTVAARSLRCAASSSNKEGFCSDRRAAVLGLATLLSPAAALALVPDQDEEDDKLIQQAKANRKDRISAEKGSDTRYSVTTGTNKNGDLAPIQRAVNRLGKTGAALAAGKVSEVSTTLNDPWVDSFKAAAEDLTTTDEARSSLKSALSGISTLSGAKEASSAKQQYASTVQSFISWVDAVGIQNSLKGIQ